MRIVLDTNVLVSSAYDELSASWEILEDCLRGVLRPIVSPDLRREYERILERAVRTRGHDAQIRDFLAEAEEILPSSTPRVVPDDLEDDKVIAAAVAGRADAIITNDQHLLDLDPYEGIRILRPVAFQHLREGERGDTWSRFAKMIGLGV